MKGSSVYLNGRLVGFHPNPKDLVETIRNKRRKGEYPWDLSVSHYPDQNEIYINGDEGRALRPVVIAENGKSRLTEEHRKLLKEGKIRFTDLLKTGVVEFIDAEEEENAYIAIDDASLTAKHTHVEMHPALMLGVTASILPFPEHNSSPRVTMGCAMTKQALGVYASNFSLRTDTQGHILYYPQLPLSRTKFAGVFKMERKSAGQNFVVAITPHFGYNMNDALVLNKASVERGLARTVFYRTYESEERRYPGGQKDRFEMPKQEVSGFRGEDAYKYLDEGGIIEPEYEVKAGDVLIGKTSPPRFLEEVSEFGVLEEKRRENSEAVRHGEEGTVDWVILTDGDGGNRLVKVRTRTIMIPEIGDKLASRHGQKGVIGKIVDAADMPFTESGIVPDLLVNPHAIPSRMTVGHMLEMLGGKAMTMDGKYVDATAFDNLKENEINETLKKYGFKPSGKEVMYDGITGERIEAEIFVGVVYYQKLKHLVANKMHARARGPVQILTRQPTEGRAREGGLRFGEMERDCLIGHGASMLLLERLLEESDKVTELVCSKCGMIAVDDQIRKKQYCPICGDSEVHRIEISYAFKLLLNELKAMCIYPRLQLKDKV